MPNVCRSRRGTQDAVFCLRPRNRQNGSQVRQDAEPSSQDVFAHAQSSASVCSMCLRQQAIDRVGLMPGPGGGRRCSPNRLAAGSSGFPDQAHQSADRTLHDGPRMTLSQFVTDRSPPLVTGENQFHPWRVRRFFAAKPVGCHPWSDRILMDSMVTGSV